MAKAYLTIDGIDYSSLVQSGISRSYDARGTIYKMLDGTLFDARETVGLTYKVTALHTDHLSALYDQLVRVVCTPGAHNVTILTDAFAGLLTPSDNMIARGGRPTAFHFTIQKAEPE